MTGITSVSVAGPPIVMPPADVFDYGAILPPQAQELRRRAEVIRAKIKTTTAAIIAVGTELIGAKKVLQHGAFVDWVQAECGFSLRTAENYIRAAEFASGKIATVANLPPAVVYKLAAKSAPTEIVQTVLQKADAGELIQAASVTSMLGQAATYRRQEARRQQQNARRSKQAVARLDDAKRRERERREQELRDADAAVQEIVAKVGIDGARFVAEKVVRGHWLVMEGLRRLLGDDGGAT